MRTRRTPAPIRAIVWLFKAVFLTVRAAFAVALGAAVLGGLPWALVRFSGWPLPHHMLSLSQLKTDLTSPILGDQFYLNAIAIVLWFLWSILAFSFLLELAYAVRRIPAPHVPGLGPAQLLAGFLITAVGVTALLGRSAAPARADISTVVPKARTAATAPAVISTHTGLRNSPTAPARETVHHVVPGDSLYKIAEEDLGNGEDWPALFKLNVGVQQRDGQHLSDPNLIQPGWDIRVTGAAATPATTAPVPAPVTPAPVATVPDRPTPDGPAPTPPSHGPSSVPLTPTAPALGTPSTSRPAPTAAPHANGNDHRSGTPSAGHAAHGGHQSGLWIELAVGGAIAASTLLALRAAAARRHKLGSLWASPYWPRPGEIMPVDTPQLPPALRPARTIALTPVEPDDGENLSCVGELDAFGAPAESLAPFDDLGTETAPGVATDKGGPDGRPSAPIAFVLPGDVSDGKREGCDPMWIPVAVTGDGRSVDLADLPGGLGLTGPGALGAARAIAAAVLGSRSPEQFGSILLIPRADAALLLDVPESDVDRLRRDVWHLRIVEDFNAAVAYLADHAAARAAALAEYGVPDFEALMQIDDLLDDPEPMVLLAVARGALDARTKALLDQPAQLRLHSVLLGAHPGGATWRIDADGEVTAGPGEPGVYAFSLSASGLRSALDVVASPEEVQPQIVAPDPLGPLAAPSSIGDDPSDETDDDAPAQTAESPSPAATAAPEQADDEHVSPDEVQDQAGDPAPPHLSAADPHHDLGRADAESPVATEPAAAGPAQRALEPDKDAAALSPQPAPVQMADRRPTPPVAGVLEPVPTGRSGLGAGDAGAELKQIQEILGQFRGTACQIRVLGPVTITTFTGPVQGTIRKGSRKLAALLAMYHERGRSTQELGVLWPDATEAKLPHIRKNDLYSLRDSLKRDVLAGCGPRHGYAAEFIPRRSGRYRLDQNYVGIDLACFEQLRTLAAGTHHRQVRRAAAEAALSLYDGELCEGMDDDWTIAPRVAVRRDALATATLLAQLAADDGDDEQALAWWERARVIDDNEEVYRQIMKTQGRLGRRADIIATRNLLEQKLDPLGESTSDATNMILAELLSERRGLPRERVGAP
ncbi:MAG: LysM peptidoglycan-binding domain-containing protein [Catenulispora sp.]|nr:LysM peptidoglycan-binding domain-containing protein [Catenulispora sp.]